MYWNQKDQAVLESGGHAKKLFLFWVVAAELAYYQNPGVFDTIEDLAAHKARIAELEAKRAQLQARSQARGLVAICTSGGSPATGRC